MSDAETNMRRIGAIIGAVMFLGGYLAACAIAQGVGVRVGLAFGVMGFGAGMLVGLDWRMRK